MGIRGHMIICEPVAGQSQPRELFRPDSLRLTDMNNCLINKLYVCRHYHTRNACVDRESGPVAADLSGCIRPEVLTCHPLRHDSMCYTVPQLHIGVELLKKGVPIFSYLEPIPLLEDTVLVIVLIRN